MSLQDRVELAKQYWSLSSTERQEAGDALRCIADYKRLHTNIGLTAEELITKVLIQYRPDILPVYEKVVPFKEYLNKMTSK